MKMIGLARLGRDAVLRYTPQGDPVANFSAAYNYGKKDGDGNRPVQFIQCTLWGKRAESLMPYLLKGKRFFIELSGLHMEEYEGKNGSGVSLVGHVTDIQFADDYEESDRPAPSRAEPAQSYAEATGRSMAAQAPAGSLADLDDDIPF